jgi:ribosome-binding protein aMBF1 (putative translation factor)
MSNNPFATTPPVAAPVAQPAAPVAPPTAAPVAFAQAAPVAPAQAAPVAAPVAAAPVAPQAVPAAPAAPAATDAKKPRKKPNRQMTLDERKYVIENYATKATSEMATELGLTRQQVYRTIHEARTKTKDRVTACRAAGDEATAVKMEQFLEAKLPEKPWGGGAGGGKGSSVDNVLDALLG